MSSNKQIPDFTSLVSHQLRTPFATINWHAEMLLSGRLGAMNPKQAKYIREIYRASRRMLDMVNTVLSISRIEKGVPAGEFGPTDISALAEAIFRERRFEIKEKNLIVRKSFEKIPKIHADPNQINMIVQNLLSNAIKYTPAGGRIAFAIKREVQQGVAGVSISMADSGIGIPKSAEKNIFGKFFRAKNARAQEAEGSGLGLYILKSVIEEMHGRIWFTSEEGKGTTFFVFLPT